jgi:hypothetical protein
MTALRLADHQTRIVFYEDFPYVTGKGAGSGEDDDPASALARLGLVPTRRYVVPANTKRQLKALSLYASQIRPLFGGKKAMREAVEARRWRGQPSEFFWSARPPQAVEGTSEDQEKDRQG